MIKTKKIVLIFGEICSGKSTYADALCYVTKAKRITVSDIVKRVSGKVSRSDLQSTAHMDQQIISELVREINKYEKVVIDGIRQHSIVIQLISEYGQDNIDMIWLEVPTEVRKYRFYDRSISKDDISFEEADLRDANLGLVLLKENLKDVYNIIKN